MEQLLFAIALLSGALALGFYVLRRKVLKPCYQGPATVISFWEHREAERAGTGSMVLSIPGHGQVRYDHVRAEHLKTLVLYQSTYEVILRTVIPHHRQLVAIKWDKEFERTVKVSDNETVFQSLFYGLCVRMGCGLEQPYLTYHSVRSIFCRR